MRRLDGGGQRSHRTPIGENRTHFSPDQESDSCPAAPAFPRNRIPAGLHPMMFRSVPLDWATTPFGIFRDPGLGRRGRWILYSAVIGGVSGLGAILFDLIFRFFQWSLLEQIGRFLPPASGMEGGMGYGPLTPWLLPLALVIGGLISGALVFGLAPEAEGHGTDAVIRSFHHLQGKIRRRQAPGGPWSGCHHRRQQPRQSRSSGGLQPPRPDRRLRQMPRAAAGGGGRRSLAVRPELNEPVP